MKKWIIISLAVLMFVGCSIAYAQYIHRIQRPTKIYGWLQVQGDVWPLWTGKYDLGKEGIWFDSSFVEQGWFHDARIDSSLIISGEIIGSSESRGQDTFSAISLVDTVVVAGVTTNSFIFLTVKSTTAPTSNLSWAYLNTDSITVHCLAVDTAMLRLNPYCWFRIE